jgi:SsrA-binding protein
VAEKIITQNKKARHDFAIVETYEAGMVLAGTEVKSCRLGKVNLKDSYGKIKGGEIFLVNCHISPYDFGNRANHDPLRERKLLFHKQEIRRLYGKVKERGFSLVPLKMYLKGGRVKVEMALGRGKKAYDKREEIRRRDLKREIQQEFRGKKLKGRF